MICIMPLLQLALFGYAINANPKHLPTALIVADHSVYTQAIISGFEHTDYFRITEYPKTLKEADNLLASGAVLFSITIPTDFSRKLVRGLHPQLLVEADGTDPIATANSTATLLPLVDSSLARYFQGPLSFLKTPAPPIDVVVHTKYNPERITQYSIIPGLLGIILTMTMVMITSSAITREYERGTTESLLATPVRPLEVMIGKIVPYIIVGYIQASVILIASFFLFSVPIVGSALLLYFCILPFIAANLTVGLTFSSISKNQLQSVQMAFFFFLPNILLSGFMFPFDGMPLWARCVGDALPLTHFLRIIRGIMLKGNDFSI
jgi:ABC-2 type transport system permease protein